MWNIIKSALKRRVHFSFHLSNPCEMAPRVSVKIMQLLIEFIIDTIVL